MRHLVLFCHRHAWWVIAGWLVVLAALTTAGAAAGSDYRDTLKPPASDSTLAQTLLAEVPGGGQGGDQERIVLTADGSGGVASAAVRERIAPMLDRVARLPHVVQVTSPYGPQGGAQISADGRTAFATVSYDVKWWLPSWLDRVVPRIAVEGPSAADAPPAAEREREAAARS
ncbi:hypothetical protein [Peterkaempfera bronchialis]|uniref:MMPL family transporter n=1 Tax=Peterkaempfera bronchialis TaxID=2126346 RepID=A0A345T3A3_9ACTN|nr:hypothetical protein [Peterkaempfera bronchialis]AXI80458.1 hypothetical protein C7M71_026700 [Peterkaempfera bronchialis]